MNEQRFYEEGEAEEILRRAAAHSPYGVIDRDQLLSMGSELGISEQAIANAEAQLAREKADKAVANAEKAERQEYLRWRRTHFWSELSSYLTACVVMSGIWFFTGKGYFWPGWIIGIGAVVTVTNFFGEVLAFSERDFQRWRKKNGKTPKVEEGGVDI